MRDAFEIHLRDCDFEEAKLWAPHVGPYISVARSIKASEKAYTAHFGGEVVGIFGYSLSDQEVHPWLMCSDLIEQHGKMTIRGAKVFLEAIRETYPTKLMCNHVCKANLRAKRFLDVLGFRVVPSPGSGPFDFFYLP